jgi:AraC-like DNA-binding protein
VFIHEISERSLPYESRNVPEGSVEVFYRLGSEVPVVAHPRDPVVTTLEPGSSYVGVQFHPGASNAILGAPIWELEGRTEGLDVVWGGMARRFGGRLADAADPEEAACLLEQALIARCAEGPRPDPLVKELVRRLRPWRARRVMDQARDLFISPRQLRRRCWDALGFGPKMLHRLLRFRAFFALVHYRADGGDLTRLAVRAGYADQAHLARECLRLSGLTPRAFVADRMATCAGSHDHSTSFADLHRVLLAAGVTPGHPRARFAPH